LVHRPPASTSRGLTRWSIQKRHPRSGLGPDRKPAETLVSDGKGFLFPAKEFPRDSPSINEAAAAQTGRTDNFEQGSPLTERLAKPIHQAIANANRIHKFNCLELLSGLPQNQPIATQCRSLA